MHTYFPLPFSLSILVPAFITTSEYNKERQKQAANPRWASETDDSG